MPEAQQDVQRAQAWDQGWRTAVAWIRLGANRDMPANPYESPAVSTPPESGGDA